MVGQPLPDLPAPLDDTEAAQGLASRVRAWQHRHPLAARVELSDVSGMGVVALPYGQGADETTAGEPLYDATRLLPGLSQRALVEFARQYAVDVRPGPANWPVRQVERIDGSAEPPPHVRYLLTAALGGRGGGAASPHRLLVAPVGPEIWGRRLPSKVRLVAAVALSAAAMAAVVGLVWWVWTVGIRTSPTATPMAPLAASAPAPSASPSVTLASAAAPVPASIPVSAPAPAPLPASVPASAPTSSHAGAVPTVPGIASSAPAISERHFALVSAPTRRRAEAEQALLRVQQMLGPAIGPLQAQVMPSPQGFVVTIWPLSTEADAQQLAEVLARRGVPMKWMEF